MYGFGAAPLDLIATAVPTLAAIRLAEARPPEWKGALGPVRLRFAMAEPTPGLDAEPLLSINGPGTKDVIYFRREEGGRIRIGFDRMGAGAILSEPLHLSGTGTEELELSLGSLMPSGDSTVYPQFPAYASLRSEAYVRFNGLVALRANAPFTPAQPRWITIGANTIGSSTYGPAFKGTISSFGTIGPENLPASARVFTPSSAITTSPGRDLAVRCAFGSSSHEGGRATGNLFCRRARRAPPTRSLFNTTAIPRSGLATPVRAFRRFCRHPSSLCQDKCRSFF